MYRTRDPQTHERVSFTTKGPSRAFQEFKDECDINVLMARHNKGQSITQNPRTPEYLDVSEVQDFHASVNFLQETQNVFDQLPAEIRKEFGNDPQAMLEFVRDEGNRERAQELGIIPTPPEEAPEPPQTPPEPPPE